MKLRKSKLCVAIGVLLFLGSMGFAAEKDLGEIKVLELNDIIANPETFKTTNITFRGQFHGLNDFFNPFYTVFDSACFLNFSAWDYNAPLWMRKAYKSDFPLLFVDKREKELSKKILNLNEFTRFEATGLIRSTFDNKPWIQITSIKTVPRSLTRETVYHLARGFYYKDKKDHVNAVLEFTQALSEHLPENVQGLILKEEGKSLFAMGSYEEAERAIKSAMRFLGDEEDLEMDSLLKEAVALGKYESHRFDKMKEEVKREAEEASEDVKVPPEETEEEEAILEEDEVQTEEEKADEEKEGEEIESDQQKEIEKTSKG